MIFDPYLTTPKILELLCDRTTNDPDQKLREWAQEQLAKWENIKESDKIQ
jgi:hypothetical protein